MAYKNTENNNEGEFCFKTHLFNGSISEGK